MRVIGFICNAKEIPTCLALQLEINFAANGPEKADGSLIARETRDSYRIINSASTSHEYSYECFISTLQFKR